VAFVTYAELPTAEAAWQAAAVEKKGRTDYNKYRTFGSSKQEMAENMRADEVAKSALLFEFYQRCSTSITDPKNGDISA